LGIVNRQLVNSYTRFNLLQIFVLLIASVSLKGNFVAAQHPCDDRFGGHARNDDS
jgi:hypothetical protein